mmetsp:Transcript_113852/g.332648  ORF Transcript_113852/g.332648 Transcript_113852/m.332648 type:complete len:667 (-) Transcript_113852:566-2566(-)
MARYSLLSEGTGGLSGVSSLLISIGPHLDAVDGKMRGVSAVATCSLPIVAYAAAAALVVRHEPALLLGRVQVAASALAVALQEHVPAAAAGPGAGRGAQGAARGALPGGRRRPAGVAAQPRGRDQELRGARPRPEGRRPRRRGRGRGHGAELPRRDAGAAEGPGEGGVHVDDLLRLVGVQQAGDHAALGLLPHRSRTLQPALAWTPTKSGISHPRPSSALRSLLTFTTTKLSRWHVVHLLAPGALDDVVDVRLEVAAVLAQGLGPHGRQAPGGVGLRGDPLLRDDARLAQPKHTEVHLAAALVVAHLELEEGDAREQRGAVRGDLQDLRQVVRLVRDDGRVVLPDEDRRAAEGAVVRVEEEAPHLGGGVLGVEAVDEAPLVGPPEVVPGRVVHGVRELHRVPQVHHLAQGREGLEGGALGAAAEGEGHGEVRGQALHRRLLLRGEHGVEGADERLAEVLGLAGKALESSLKLEIRLVHNDHHPEGRVVAARAREEAVLQVLGVLAPDLLVAVVGGVEAAAGHLHVGVVAEPRHNLQSLPLGLVQEGPVVQCGVVAVESHGVGAERPHDAQVMTSTARVAPRTPKGRGVAGHEVVVWHHATCMLQRHRRIADSLYHALLVRTSHRRGPWPERVWSCGGRCGCRSVSCRGACGKCGGRGGRRGRSRGG